MAPGSKGVRPVGWSASLVTFFSFLSPKEAFSRSSRTRGGGGGGKVALESPVFQRSRSCFMLGCGAVGGDYQKKTLLSLLFFRQGRRRLPSSLPLAITIPPPSSSSFAKDKKMFSWRGGKLFLLPSKALSPLKSSSPLPLSFPSNGSEETTLSRFHLCRKRKRSRSPLFPNTIPSSFPAEIRCIHNTHRWKRRRSGQACLSFLL